jgi:hypothetical protein
MRIRFVFTFMFAWSKHSPIANTNPITTIMRIQSILAAFAPALLLLSAGCSSTTPARVDTGPLKARTFAFVNTAAKPPPEFAENRQQIHTSVQQAITANLASKGLTRVATGGDVTVAYLIILGNNASTTSINEYFGYGEDASALVDKAHAKATSSQNPKYFEAGTLVIDIIDSKNFSLLRRNYAARQLHREAPPEVRQARLQEAVNEALAGLRTAQ